MEVIKNITPIPDLPKEIRYQLDLYYYERKIRNDDLKTWMCDLSSQDRINWWKSVGIKTKDERLEELARVSVSLGFSFTAIAGTFWFSNKDEEYCYLVTEEDGIKKYRSSDILEDELFGSRRKR